MFSVLHNFKFSFWTSLAEIQHLSSSRPLNRRLRFLSDYLTNLTNHFGIFKSAISALDDGISANVSTPAFLVSCNQTELCFHSDVVFVLADWFKQNNQSAASDLFVPPSSSSVDTRRCSSGLPEDVVLHLNRPNVQITKPSNVPALWRHFFILCDSKLIGGQVKKISNWFLGN